MATATLNANRSVFIDANSATSNFDSAPQIDVGEVNFGSERRRALIGWDTSSITNGSVINSCDFKIYDSGSDLTDNARTMNVAQLLTSWVEAEATWNVKSTAVNWGTAGAGNASDRSSSIGSQSMPNPPVIGYKTITLTTAEIQKWFNGVTTQNGLTVYMDTEVNDSHRFNGSGEANPPQLVIDYTEPPAGGYFFMTT